MKFKLILLLALLTPAMGAEQDRSVEKTLSSLANIIIPRIDFDQEITVEEAVDFLNLILHAPDPPPPRHWKIRLDVPEKLKMAKIPLVGKDLHLHEILGKIADTIGAEVVATRYGYVLREPQPLAPDEEDGWTPPIPPKREDSAKGPAK